MESHVKPVSCSHTIHRLLTLHREGWHARNDTPDPSLIVSFLLSCEPDLSYRLAHLTWLYEKGPPAVYARAQSVFKACLVLFFYETFVIVWDQVPSAGLITANALQHIPKVPFKSSSLTTPSLATFKKSKFKSTLVCMNFLLLLRRI